MDENIDLYDIKSKIPPTALKLHCFYGNTGKTLDYKMLVVNDKKIEKILMTILFVNGSTAERLNTSTFKRRYPMRNGPYNYYIIDYFVVEKSFYKALEQVKKYVSVEDINV